MAIDTRSKRASVIGVASAMLLTLPLADGTVGQPDRQHVALCYAGIQAAEAVVATPRVVAATAWASNVVSAIGTDAA
jgi:hypothetical protein